MRLIDADAIDYKIPEQPDLLTRAMILAVQAIIRNQPTVVPQDRCKDCLVDLMTDDGK